MILQPKCWIDHVSLNYSTGMDPDGIKLRHAAGFQAADYLIAGFWVWAKLIEQLALLGYDPNSMQLSPYDWRLGLVELEVRDHTFTKLKSNIELLYVTNENRKVVVISHSWGSNIFSYFLIWVTRLHGKDWVDIHVDSFVNIGGPLLGLPKSVPSLLSAEMRDSAELSPPLAYIKDQLYSPEDAVRMFRSWGSIAHLLPKGGEDIWSSDGSGPILSFSPPNPNISPNDYPNSTLIPGPEPFIDPMVRYGLSLRNYTTNGFFNVLRTISPKWMTRISNTYSYGAVYSEEELRPDDPRTWTNPLESQLPMAPNMKIYCMYGVGQAAERSFVFRMTEPNEVDNPSMIPFRIDTSVRNPPNGVHDTDGDGTVPLLSNGYMCRGAWKTRLFNPSKMEVITREYIPNTPVSFREHGEAIFRESGASSDHVDIMGNHDLILDILKILVDEKVEDKIISDIDELVRKTPLYSQMYSTVTE